MTLPRLRPMGLHRPVRQASAWLTTAGLLSHANVPGRDLPHGEDDVEKPKASEEDPGHHLRFKMS